MGYPNEHGQSDAAMAELGWKTLKVRRLQSKTRLMYMYKITHGLAPIALSELFSFTSVIRAHDHNLRNSEMNLYIPFPNSDYHILVPLSGR